MIGAALALAAQALPPNFPNGAETSIEQVRADPRRWDGKWVKFTGWMHRCSSLDCSVSERPLGGGMSLSFETADALDRWVQPLLPAEVVVVAKIDSTCLIEMCVDRAPVLREPFVMTLRWNASDPDKER